MTGLGYRDWNALPSLQVFNELKSSGDTGEAHCDQVATEEGGTGVRGDPEECENAANLAKEGEKKKASMRDLVSSTLSLSTRRHFKKKQQATVTEQTSFLCST